MKQLHNFSEVFDSQAVYRKLLEAMANPLRKVSIKAQADKMYGADAPFLALAMTLLDNETSFNADSDQKLTDDIVLLTSAKRTNSDSADFIFAADPEKAVEIIAHAKSGTLADPHKSATIIIKDNEAENSVISAYGAGINGVINVNISGNAKRAVSQRDAQNYEYPQGVDMIFVRDTGDIYCIPRLVMVKGEE